MLKGRREEEAVEAKEGQWEELAGTGQCSSQEVVVVVAVSRQEEDQAGTEVAAAAAAAGLGAACLAFAAEFAGEVLAAQGGAAGSVAAPGADPGESPSDVHDLERHHCCRSEGAKQEEASVLILAGSL